ncbi:DUF924 family protein [Ancylobacter sp. G4_0304]|uniref:DUF924 family protein n=1 Tax=Ancylobacter sp. G4_0304 TaxID=3114289 RepID=UPI0039C5E6D5
MNDDTQDAEIAAVTGFWRDAGPERWFEKNPAFDAAFHDRFRDLHFAAAARTRDGFMASAEGALALILLLDQFPRNCFRSTAHMYATDPLARHFARLALARGYPGQLEMALRVFFFLPFSHSENLADQDIAVELNRANDPDSLKHALGHREIIARFGRFPHRNPLLGRDTTPDEARFLEEGGFAG